MGGEERELSRVPPFVASTPPQRTTARGPRALSRAASELPPWDGVGGAIAATAILCDNSSTDLRELSHKDVEVYVDIVRSHSSAASACVGMGRRRSTKNPPPRPRACRCCGLLLCSDRERPLGDHEFSTVVS
ncbi:hypothetical protein [Oryza sativa Japonica Group]|uniref:Uncharacterized protein n=1 Tax=Oryza sativa subsp. japonica TaxID=39947 RepID=Q5JN74_ORYSJ|nr:hypothetical protein [Oryza sativa Japonica Group]